MRAMRKIFHTFTKTFAAEHTVSIVLLINKIALFHSNHISCFENFEYDLLSILEAIQSIWFMTFERNKRDDIKYNSIKHASFTADNRRQREIIILKKYLIPKT